MAYAHSRGVIHRDLKPENIMLGPYGETLVVDWGLAKLVQKAEPPPSPEPEDQPTRSTLHPMGEGSPTPTQIGTVVGTLAYMSPEQAAGLVDQLTPASDIYSLGGTLFTLLCGRAPFEGIRPEELRHEIIMGKHPTPRQIDAQRAAGARGHLPEGHGHRPRAALRLGAGVGRRDRGLAGRRAGRRVARAVPRAGPAMDAAAPDAGLRRDGRRAGGRREPGRGRGAARRGQRTRTVGQDPGPGERRAARENFQLAREAVDKYLTRVSEDPRLKAHNLEPLRRDLLETARDFYERFIQQHPDEPELQAAAGWAHVRLASITAEIGSKRRAIELLRQASGIFTALAEEHPDEAGYQTGLLKSRVELAELYCTVSQPHDAAKVLEPMPKKADALAAADREAADSQALVASALTSSAKVYLAQKKPQEADAAYKEAIAIREALVKQYPDVADYRARLARDKGVLGMLCRDWARAEEAAKLINEAADLSKGLIATYPDVPEYQRDLATALENMATIIRRSIGPEVGRRETLQDGPQLPRKPGPLASRSDRVPGRRRAGALPPGVVVLARGAIEGRGRLLPGRAKYLDRLVAEHGEVPDFSDMLGSTLNNLALIHSVLSQHDEVPALMKGAIDIRRKLSEEYPDNFVYWGNLGSSQRNFADWLWNRNRVAESESPYRDAAKTYQRLVERFPDDVLYAEQLADRSTTGWGSWRCSRTVPRTRRTGA